MKISTATSARTLALLVVLSACGGGISLGSNDGPSADGGGNPASSVGKTTGPSAEASTGRPAIDASLPPSLPDAGPSTDDAAGTSADAANPGLFAALSDCGYTQVDPHNCGSCGHDCSGGACQAGVCVPLPAGVLASGLIAPTSVAVDANNVYWLSEGVRPNPEGGAAGLVQVMKCAKTGCNNRPTVLASGVWDFFTGKDTLHGLTVDAMNVYWATEQGLFACAVDGCNNSPTMLLSTGPVLPPSTISVSGGVVYDVSFSGVIGCATSGCNGDGGGAGASNVLWQGQVQGVLADSTTAYWHSNGTILSCALGGCNGAPTLLQQMQLVSSVMGVSTISEPIGQIAQDDNYLYYTIGSQQPFELANGPGYIASGGIGVLYSCSKKGIASGGTALLSSGVVTPLGVATDGTNVYFTDLGNGAATNATNIGRIGKCSVTACAPDCSTYSDCPKIGMTIAGRLENPRGIAVDHANVYWSDFGSGTLDSNAALLLSVDGRIVTSPK